jgi:hypothetical protein
MKKIRPFSTGSEFVDWCSENCDSCRISTSYRDSSDFICHLEEALIIAYFDDGHVDKSIIEKIGGKKLFLSNCAFKNKIKYTPVSLDFSVFQQLRLF